MKKENFLLPSVGCAGCLMNIVISIGIGCFIASLVCDINPERTYSWYSGIWHGVFFIPNLLRHFFDSAILYKANFYTTAYNVWWWIVVSGIALGIIGGGSKRN